MSDIGDEPTDDEITYEDAREAQNDLQGLIREKGDYEEAVKAQQRGERPKEPPANESMP